MAEQEEPRLSKADLVAFVREKNPEAFDGSMADEDVFSFLVEQKGDFVSKFLDKKDPGWQTLADTAISQRYQPTALDTAADVVKKSAGKIAETVAPVAGPVLDTANKAIDFLSPGFRPTVASIGQAIDRPLESLEDKLWTESSQKNLVDKSLGRLGAGTINIARDFIPKSEEEVLPALGGLVTSPIGKAPQTIGAVRAASGRMATPGMVAGKGSLLHGVETFAKKYTPAKLAFDKEALIERNRLLKRNALKEIEEKGLQTKLAQNELDDFISEFTSEEMAGSPATRGRAIQEEGKKYLAPQKAAVNEWYQKARETVQGKDAQEALVNLAPIVKEELPKIGKVLPIEGTDKVARSLKRMLSMASEETDDATKLAGLLGKETKKAGVNLEDLWETQKFLGKEVRLAEDAWQAGKTAKYTYDEVQAMNKLSTGIKDQLMMAGGKEGQEAFMTADKLFRQYRSVAKSKTAIKAFADNPEELFKMATSGETPFKELTAALGPKGTEKLRKEAMLRLARELEKAPTGKAVETAEGFFSKIKEGVKLFDTEDIGVVKRLTEGMDRKAEAEGVLQELAQMQGRRAFDKLDENFVKLSRKTDPKNLWDKFSTDNTTFLTGLTFLLTRHPYLGAGILGWKFGLRKLGSLYLSDTVRKPLIKALTTTDGKEFYNAVSKMEVYLGSKELMKGKKDENDK